MSVKVTLSCGGCDATTGPYLIRRPLKRLTPNFCRKENWNVEQGAPDNWVVDDPFTGACYCPECWKKIIEP